MHPLLRNLVLCLSFILVSAPAEYSYAEKRYAQACPNGYVRVPGDNSFRTRKFCIMKWEAKCGLENGQSCTGEKGSRVPISEAYSTPWVSISQQDSITECASLGMGYKLIRNNEWMVVQYRKERGKLV